jgi:SRSO17 transposase
LVAVGGYATSKWDSGANDRLATYLKRAGEVVGNKRRRASFNVYAMGLIGDGERKSAEPIAARACRDPALVDAYHQRLTYFLSESGWSDAPVRLFAARYALEEMTRKERVSRWVIDDTAFEKQGTHSVAVQRQYARAIGRVANCQIAVSLAVATRSACLPIDFELYLPRCWADKPIRRIEAHIPDGIAYQTMPALAMQMVRRALAHQVPVGVVLTDSPCGDSSAFRRGLHECGLDYAVGVQAPTEVWRVDSSGARRGQPMRVEDVARDLKADLRKVSWCGGKTARSWSRFACCRVRPVHCASGDVDDVEVWLLVETPPDEATVRGFWLLTLPRSATLEELVRLIKERGPTQRTSEGLKADLGLDHFEGRTYRGWHHHVTVALVCNAFISAERARRSRVRVEDEAIALDHRARLTAEAPRRSDS